MKKVLFTLLSVIIGVQNVTFACGGYDGSESYFNLFTQHIVNDKSFTPFFRTYSIGFYDEEGRIEIPDENIEDWQTYFQNQLTYAQCKELVYKVSMNDLNALKKGKEPKSKLVKKLTAGFYKKYQEGIDYLIEAKYLQPYMRIKHQASEEGWDYYDEEKSLDATNLNYEHTVSALISLYNAAQNPQIKLRYGYQLVRFYHYTRKYQEAVKAFDTYVKTLGLKMAPYYLALDQYAGVLRALGMADEANWNFFQVFLHSKSRKASVYSSLTFGDEETFNQLLNRAKSTKEKVMAYFLLGYRDFNNPLSMIEKIAKLDPNSEALMVLEARAINDLERVFLSSFTASYTVKKQEVQKEQEQVKEKVEIKKQKLSLWDKIVRFFERLFGVEQEKREEQSVEQLTEEPQKDKEETLDIKNRLPQLPRSLYDDTSYKETEKQLSDLEDITLKVRKKSKDAFWDLAYAYVKFLQKDYTASQEILTKIKTSNAEYKAEITKMKMLNEIVAQPTIDKDFEEHLAKKYAKWFIATKDEFGYYNLTETGQFIVDILANRYLLQGEHAKSFLMNNSLNELMYNPDVELAKSLENFYKKENKSSLEKKVIMPKMDLEDPLAFFQSIYGDNAMREAHFSEAEAHYKKAKKGKGFVPTEYTEWNYETDEKKVFSYAEKGLYDGFNRISFFILGRNKQESFRSKVRETMELEPFMKHFPFIKKQMNKTELAEVLVRLQKMGSGEGERASEANQLIANLLYNTTKLGYFRNVFVMDLTNGTGPKYHFYNSKNKIVRYYYKNYTWMDINFPPDNFDLVNEYYQKALSQTKNKERKARILFQMASAEQGKFYQWMFDQPEIPYSDDDWWEKEKAQEFMRIKNEKFRTYFRELKNHYSDTKTVESLEQSCSYFEHFMKN